MPKILAPPAAVPDEPDDDSPPSGQSIPILFEASAAAIQRVTNAATLALVNAVRTGYTVSTNRFTTVNNRPCLLVLAVGDEAVNSVLEDIGLAEEGNIKLNGKE